MEQPDIHYLPTERGAIAYQRFGEGDRTIVWASPPFVPIESRWVRAGATRLWEFLASLGTVVLFDFRGTASSERLPADRVGTLDEMCFDLAALLDHFRGASTELVATGTSTMAAVAYAVDHPDGIDHLILLNATAAHPRRGEDEDAVAGQVLSTWGRGDALALAAKMEPDPALRREAARSERAAATPEMAAAWTRRLMKQDVTGLLGRVRTPTLVIHTGDLPYITPESSEAVAAGIPQAEYLLRPSSFFNWGEWGRDIERFITGSVEAEAGHRDLTAVMFTDVVGSTNMASRVGDAAWRDTLGHLDAFVSRTVTGGGGRVVKQTGDGHLIEFARPGQALQIAAKLVAQVPDLGVTLRVGVHFGEVERRPDGDIGGIAVHLAARIADQAGSGEILVSRTVAELTAGEGRRFSDRGTPQLKGIPGEWPLLALERG